MVIVVGLERFWVKSRARIDNSNMSQDMSNEVNAYLIRVYYINHLNFISATSTILFLQMAGKPIKLWAIFIYPTS